jgi:hypothetical protein
MPNTFRISVAGGIDAVSDLALSDDGRVVYMENLDVRGGIARPYNVPKIDPNLTVTEGSIQIYSYRGRLIFSAARRSYVSEYMNDLERIHWTEYGDYPMKMVSGVEVSLGTPRPSTFPLLNAGKAVAPTNITLTESTGGSLSEDTPISFRLAYSTPLGVFPASGVIKTDITVDDSRLTLSWENPVTDIPVIEIYLFMGTGKDDESFLKSLPAKTVTYEIRTIVASSGELATLYNQALNYQYCVTYVRNVMGVENESGPSAPSPSIVAAASRKVTFSPWSEGILDSLNTVTWANPAQPNFELVLGSELAGYSVGNALTVESIVSETDTDRILCTFSVQHHYCDRARIMIAGCSPDPFAGLPVEIQVEDGMSDSCYLIVGYDFVAPGADLAGVTAYRVASVQIASMHFNPDAAAVEVVASSAHTFASEWVQFTGFSDTNWNNQHLKVIPDVDDSTRFFVPSVAMPIGYAGSTGCEAKMALTSLAYATTGATGTMPAIGDILYMDFASTGTTGAANIKDALEALYVADDGVLVNHNLPGATVAGGASYTAGIQFVPKNDYITHRRLYRTGGTSSFQLVRELRLGELEFLDAIPDSGLGDILPTLYTDNDVGVVFEPAPFGLDGLTSHYGMGFAWDPSSNQLRWTPINMMDAWPPEFYRNFDSRILHIESFNQALCVFCEDGIYRIEGTVPSNLMRHKTKAAPCRAGGSVQFLNNSLIYLSDQGLMAFNGQESKCLTDLKIPGEFWLGTSRYLDGSEPGGYLVPFGQNAAFERLRGPDLPSVTPRCLMPYLVQHSNQRGVRSFVHYGKYYLYWGGDCSEYAAQTMVCIDFSSPQSPICILGIKAQDVFVDELQRVHMLLRAPCSFTWDCPTSIANPTPGEVVIPTEFTVTVSGGSSFVWTLTNLRGQTVTFVSAAGSNPMTIDSYAIDSTFTLTCVVDGVTTLTQVIQAGTAQEFVLNCPSTATIPTGSADLLAASIEHGWTFGWSIEDSHSGLAAFTGATDEEAVGIGVFDGFPDGDTFTVSCLVDGVTTLSQVVTVGYEVVAPTWDCPTTLPYAAPGEPLGLVVTVTGGSTYSWIAYLAVGNEAQITSESDQAICVLSYGVPFGEDPSFSVVFTLECTVDGTTVLSQEITMDGPP